jgi:GntR family transcriptional regulator/MocR family aminotransferase
MWLRAYHRSRIAALADEAARAGVGLYPVTPYYLRPPARAGLLIGYACLDEPDIRRGIAVLSRCMDQLTS